MAAVTESPSIVTVEPDHMMAQIVKITSISPIPKADKIEIAQVLGWEVVVGKGDFKVGDLAIFFSIDSVLDVTHPAVAGSRFAGKPLKTVKMFGVTSQGLLGSLDWLEHTGLDKSVVKEDDDVTKQMGVKKWVPSGEEDTYLAESKGDTFPSYVPKTEEERVQNISRKLPLYENKNVVLTQKFDGASTTVGANDDKFFVCSRNTTLDKDNETHDTSHFFEIVKRYDLERKILELKRNIAIQGETIGPKINGNRHKMTERDFFVFNIYDIDAKAYVSYDEILDITSKLGLKTVTLVYRGVMKPEWLNVNALMELAEKQKYPTGEKAEGLVLKTDYGIGHPRMSCKIVAKNYLIKHNL